MMFQLDSDFKELFKIKAEFDTVMDRPTIKSDNMLLGYVDFAKEKN